MSKPSNLYYKKAENGTVYRIYLMDFGNDPWLCRSALDAADGVHGEMVERINGVTEAVHNSIIDNYAPAIGYEKANEIACDVARSFIVATMKDEGWTIFSE